MSEVKTKSVKTDKDFDNEALGIKEILAAQKKVRIKLTMEPEEKQKYDNALAAYEKDNTKVKPSFPTIPVGINGFTYFIPKGESTEVPESIFEILEHAGLV